MEKKQLTESRLRLGYMKRIESNKGFTWSFQILDDDCGKINQFIIFELYNRYSIFWVKKWKKNTQNALDVHIEHRFFSVNCNRFRIDMT